MKKSDYFKSYDIMLKKLLNKVPEITLFFWIIKIMATTVGETAADFLSFNLHLGLVNTSWIMGGLLLIIGGIQVTAKKYIPALYRLTVVLISIVGTLISDNLVDNLGISLTTTSIIFGVSTIIAFAARYISEKTLSIHSITSTKRELFYRGAILCTFALGTSVGDLIGESFGLGYAMSGLLFAGVIAVTYLAYRIFNLNAILAFWVAYITTRPLGASIGDLLTQAPSAGGLGISGTSVNLVFFVCIVGLIGYLTVTKKDAISVS